MAEYKPLFVYLEPASIPQVVAHIQKYLAENPIISDEETIAELIREYIAAHPELLAVSSVNGETGNVVLTGSDININASSAVSVETQLSNLASMINSTGADITQIESNITQIYMDIGTLQTNVETNASNISALQTSVEGQGTRLAKAETDIDNLETAQTAQGTRINTAEGNISSLQTRMTQAETDIDNVESGVNTNAESISSIRTSIGHLNEFSQTVIQNTNYQLINNIIWKKGDVVTVRFRFNKPLDGNTTIGTVPEGFRPPFDVSIRVPCDNAIGCPIAISTSGEIQTSTGISGDIRCTITYSVN
jgi:hypothetical protein